MAVVEVRSPIFENQLCNDNIRSQLFCKPFCLVTFHLLLSLYEMRQIDHSCLKLSTMKTTTTTSSTTTPAVTEKEAEVLRTLENMLNYHDEEEEGSGVIT